MLILQLKLAEALVLVPKSLPSMYSSTLVTAILSLEFTLTLTVFPLSLLPCVGEEIATTGAMVSCSAEFLTATVITLLATLLAAS